MTNDSERGFLEPCKVSLDSLVVADLNYKKIKSMPNGGEKILAEIAMFERIKREREV